MSFFHHFIGSMPCCCRYWLVRLKWWLPNHPPRLADSGDGWTDCSIKWRELSMSCALLRAYLLPAAPLVTSGSMFAHGQRGVEQQHALLCPAYKASALRHRRAQVVLNLFEYVDKRWRKRHAVAHREAQSLSLPRLVVGVLSEYHHLNLVERAQVEGVEDKSSRRIARMVAVFVVYKVDKIGKVRLFKLTANMLFPRLFYLYVHNSKCNFLTNAKIHIFL